jgi:hypothetical protein
MQKLNDERKEIKSSFQRKGILLAYLFGSGSKKGDEPGPLSDLDFAVYLEKGLSKTEKQKLHLEILSDLISILGDDIDLVIMNDASILMQFNIIKSGEVLFQRSEADKIKIESAITRNYLDLKYYLERQAEEKISRIAQRGLT